MLTLRVAMSPKNRLNDELERFREEMDIIRRIGVSLALCSLEVLFSNLSWVEAVLTFVGSQKNGGIESPLGQIPFQIFSRSLFISCSIRRFLVGYWQRSVAAVM
jgi:hypothetical protein